jgi:hypothetical protein
LLQTYARTYDAAEEKYRLGVFTSNMEIADKLTLANNGSAVFGVSSSPLLCNAKKRLTFKGCSMPRTMRIYA